MQKNLSLNSKPICIFFFIVLLGATHPTLLLRVLRSKFRQKTILIRTCDCIVGSANSTSMQWFPLEMSTCFKLWGEYFSFLYLAILFLGAKVESYDSSRLPPFSTTTWVGRTTFSYRWHEALLWVWKPSHSLSRSFFSVGGGSNPRQLRTLPPCRRLPTWS